MANASSMLTFCCSATTPLACSITIRGIERPLQLPGDVDLVPDAALLKDADGRRVRQRLADVHLLRRHLSRLGIEDVHGADDVGAEPERQGVHHVKAGAQGHGAEAGPPALGLAQTLVDDLLASALAVEAGPFLVLDLEQLGDPHALGR